MKKQKHAIFVKIDGAERDYDGRHYGWIRAFPVILQYSHGGQLTDEWNGQAVDFKFCSHYVSDGPNYEYLQGCALLSSDVSADRQTVNDGEICWQDIHKVRTYEMERMLKSGKTIERKMQKVDEQYGHTLSFGQFVGRFANAIGAEQIVTRSSPQREANTGEKWEFHDVKFGIMHIDRMIQEWNQKNNPAHAIGGRSNE